MTLVYVFLGLVLLRVVVLAIGFALIIRPVNACPACFHDTLKLQRIWLARLLPWMEWRWCPSCSWQGPARVSPQHEPMRHRLEHRRAS